MNAMLNINVRVQSAAALAQLKQLQQRLNSTQAAGSGAAGGVGSLNRSFAMTGMEKFGKNLQWTGRQLEYNFTLPLGLAGYAASKWAMENERASVQVSKVYGDVADDATMLQKELDALSKSFELMSSRFGVNQAEVIGIGAAWAQAGAAGVAVAKATKLSLEAMIIGDMDAIEATNGLIAIQSAYRLNTEQLKDAMAQLNIVENQTSIGFKGLIDVITRSGGVARTAGIDIRHLAAMAATLVPAAGSSAQAGNALRTMISRLMAPTREATELMAQMGINVMDASWQAKDGVQRIEAMAVAFDDLTQSQKMTVSAAAASRWQINRFDLLMEDVALSLDEATAKQSTYAKALEATGDAQKYNETYARELSKVLSTDARAFSILTNIIKNALAEAILPAIPAFIQLFSYVAKGAMWFADLSPEVQGVVIMLGAMLAVVGPVTRYIGSFALLFTTAGHALAFFRGIMIGHTVATTAAKFAAQGMAAAEAQQAAMTHMANASLLQKHGILGGLIVLMGHFTKALLLAPFRIFGATALAAWWIVSNGAKVAVAAVSVAWKSLAVIAPYLYNVAAGSLTALRALTANALGWFRVIHTATAVGVTGVWGATAAFFKAVWLTAMVGVNALWATFSRGVVVAAQTASFLWQGAANFFLAAWQAAVTAYGVLMRVAALMNAAAARGMIGIWQVVSATMGVMFGGLARMLAGIPSLVLGAWRAIPAAASAMWSALIAIWRAGSMIIIGMQQLVQLAILNPYITLAVVGVAAVAAFVYSIRDQLGGIAQYIVDTLAQLPNAVVSIFNRLVRIIREAALAVYEWLSYINPFVRHSPSLVESVRMGVATILTEYGKLQGVTSVIRGAIGALESFKQATGGAMADFQMGEMRQKATDIVAVSPDAGPATDRLISSINTMYGALDRVNAQIAEQTRLVDTMQRQIDTAMKPYNDALFENEMAQKRLRLEMLKIEQAGGSIEDIRSKFASLSGEIEVLSGKRNDLRLAGAGSDVLGFYDQQIDALEQQRKAMAGMKDPADEMKNALEQLQREGEILQLEKDLQFDPQLAALEAQRDKLGELNDAYSDMKGLINDMEGALTEMGSAASRALADAAAAAGGELSHAEQMFAAGAAGDFEVPGGDTPPGLGREGGLAEIEAFNADMEKELQAALDGMGGMDLLGPFKDMWNTAWGWLQENVGPYLEPIIGAIQDWFSGIDWGAIGEIFTGLWDNISSGTGTAGAVFDSLKGIFGGFLDVVKTVWNFLIETFGPVFVWIAEQIAYVAGEIGGELKNWGSLFEPAIEAVGHIVTAITWGFQNVIVPIIKIALGAILAIWKFVWPLLSNILEPIIRGIVGVIRAGLEIVRGIIGFVLNLINGDWGKAWESFLTIVDGVWDAIYTAIKFPIDLIIGIVKGLIEGIIGFFSWLYDVLVGHSIIPDLMNAIVTWFQFILSPIKAVWEAIGKIILWAWDNLIKPVWDGIVIFWNAILSPLLDRMLLGFSNIWTAIGGAVKWAWENLIKPIWNGMKSLWDTVFVPWLNGIGTIFKSVWDGIAWAIGGAVSMIGSVWAGLKSLFSDPVNWIIRNVINKFIDAINWVANKIPGISLNLGHVGEVSSGGGGGGNPNRSGVPIYHSGGIVGGPTDEQIALLQRGEGVLRREAMDKLGKEQFEMLNKGIVPTAPETDIFAKVEQGGFPGSGIINNAIKAMKDTVLGPLREAAAWAAEGMMKPVMNAIDRVFSMVPGGFGKILSGGSRALGDQIIDWIRGAEDFIEKENEGRGTHGMAGDIQSMQGKSGSYRTLMAFMGKTGVAHRISSTVRPGAITAAGNASLHGMARAIDISGQTPSLDSQQLANIFNAFKGIEPYLAELIYAGPQVGYNIKNGRQVAKYAQAQHHDHVHAALWRGGIVRGSREGTEIVAGDRGNDEAILPLPSNWADGGFGTTENHFYGDFVFPNIRSGEDAEKFMENLSDLAGVG